MSIAEHFKKHGAIHALWTIAILVAIISALVLIVPNGTLIRDYISFASAVSSIILAVVAIFYSIFSNQSFSQMVGSLQASVQNTEQSSRRLGEASASLMDLAEKMSAEVSSLTPRIDAIDSKIERGLSPERMSYSTTTPDTVNSQKSLDVKNITSGVAVCLHAIVKMDETEKEFDVKSAFNTVTWQHYIAGCFSTMLFFKPFGIEVKRAGPYSYRLETLSTETKEIMKDIVEHSKTSAKMIDEVDQFFLKGQILSDFSEATDDQSESS